MPAAPTEIVLNDNSSLENDITGTRQERQLMRQRGAGSRQVTNIDFDFAFPTPRKSLARRSLSRTPGALRQVPHKSLRKSGQAINTHRSVDSGFPANTRRVKSVESVQAGWREDIDDLQCSTPKRRKLTDVTNTAGRVNQKDALVHEKSLARDLALYSTDGADGIHGSTPAILLSRPAPASEARTDQENLRASVELETETANYRESIPISLQSLSRPRLSPVLPHAGKVLGHVVVETGVQGIDHGRNPSLSRHESTETENVDQQLTAVQSVPDMRHSLPVKKRRKRKSIAGPKRRPKRQSTDGSPRRHRDLSSAGRADSVPQLDGISPSRSNPRTTPPYRPTYPLSEASEDEYQPDAPSPDSVRVQSRRRKLAQPRVSCPKNVSVLKKKSFPVTVHRVRNAESLPPVFEDDENGQVGISVDDCVTAPRAAFSRKPQPNAVEVLSQICSETISKHIHSLRVSPSADSTSTVSSRRAQITLLESFSTTLLSELLVLSQTLDNRSHLEARLRKSQKEKASLQAQWLAVRHRRDRLALKGDQLRREHWEQERISNRAWRISEAARKFDVSAEHSTTDDKWNGLEFTLRTVSADVSFSGGGAGILDQVRKLNSLLETLVDDA